MGGGVIVFACLPPRSPLIYIYIYIYIYTRSSCALRAHSDRRGPVGHAPWIRTRKRNRWMRRIRRQIKIHKTRKEGGGDAGSGPPETQKTWPEWWSRNPQISSNGPEKSLVFEVEGSGSVVLHQSRVGFGQRPKGPHVPLSLSLSLNRE